MLYGELSLDELLAEPIIRLVMGADGIAEDDIRRLMDEVWRSLQLNPLPPPSIGPHGRSQHRPRAPTGSREPTGTRPH